MDESNQSTLALPAARLFTHDLELSGAMAAAHRLLLPSTGWLSKRLHALNAHKQVCWERSGGCLLSAGGAIKAHMQESNSGVDFTLFF